MEGEKFGGRKRRNQKKNKGGAIPQATMELVTKVCGRSSKVKKRLCITTTPLPSPNSLTAVRRGVTCNKIDNIIDRIIR